MSGQREATAQLRTDPDGVLVLLHAYSANEPICSSCGQPIMWVLDMGAFTYDSKRGGYSYQHARCAWKPEAFTEQRRQAKRLQSVRAALLGES